MIFMLAAAASDTKPALSTWLAGLSEAVAAPLELASVMLSFVVVFRKACLSVIIIRSLSDFLTFHLDLLTLARFLAVAGVVVVAIALIGFLLACAHFD